MIYDNNDLAVEQPTTTVTDESTVVNSNSSSELPTQPTETKKWVIGKQTDNYVFSHLLATNEKDGESVFNIIVGEPINKPIIRKGDGQHEYHDFTYSNITQAKKLAYEEIKSIFLTKLNTLGIKFENNPGYRPTLFVDSVATLVKFIDLRSIFLKTKSKFLDKGLYSAVMPTVNVYLTGREERILDKSLVDKEGTNQPGLLELNKKLLLWFSYINDVSRVRIYSFNVKKHYFEKDNGSLNWKFRGATFPRSKKSSSGTMKSIK